MSITVELAAGPAGEQHVGYYESPIGLIEVSGSATAVHTLYFVESKGLEANPSPIITEAVDQLDAYFAGTRESFDLPIAVRGTDFQIQVWRHLATIPYGRTMTYGEVALAIGRPDAVRAVGAANGQNPVSIILPCHRVVGRDGALTGYGGGLWRKEWLLKHEGWLLL